MAREYSKSEIVPGLAWRSAVSAVVAIGWVIFVIVFLFFYAQDYVFYKTIAILLISVLVMAAILAPIWIVWGIMVAHKESKRKRRTRKK